MSILTNQFSFIDLLLMKLIFPPIHAKNSHESGLIFFLHKIYKSIGLGLMFLTRFAISNNTTRNLSGLFGTILFAKIHGEIEILCSIVHTLSLV